MHGLPEFTLHFSDSAAFARMWLTELARGRLFVPTKYPPRLGSLASLRIEVEIGPSLVTFNCTVAVLSRRAPRGALTGGFGCELEAVPSWEQTKLERALAEGIEKQDADAEAIQIAISEVPTLDEIRVEERRRFVRVDYAEPVVMNMGLHHVMALGHDLSAGGLGIETSEPIYTGNDVALELPLPDGGPPIITLARASWTATHGNFIAAGLEFQNPTNTTLARIKSCVSDTPSIFDPPV